MLNQFEVIDVRPSCAHFKKGWGFPGADAAGGIAVVCSRKGLTQDFDSVLTGVMTVAHGCTPLGLFKVTNTQRALIGCAQPLVPCPSSLSFHG